VDKTLQFDERFIIGQLPWRMLAECRRGGVDWAGEAAVLRKARAADEVDRDAGAVGRILDRQAQLQGQPVRADQVEDYASAQFRLANGVDVRLTCSWNLNAGRDAIIEASFYRTAGGAQMRNESGSFFDFTADLFKGREARPIALPPDDWSGRTAVDWVRKLSAGETFAGSTDGLIETARILDRLYGRGW
jgi:predicted dehydrogenase